MIKQNASDVTATNDEAGVIATLLKHPDYYCRTRGLLSEHFTDKENRIIYTAIGMLEDSGVTSPVDALTIESTLKSSPKTAKLAQQLNVRGLAEFIQESDRYSISAPTPEIYDTYVHNVLTAAYRRTMAETLSACYSACCNDPTIDVEHLVRARTDAVLEKFAFINDVAKPYREIVDNCWKEIKERQGDGVVGIPFKFPLLNEYASIEKGELFLFAAGPKQGKSMMLLNCAVDLLQKDKSVLYIDSELNDRFFTARLISHLTGISYRKLLSGTYEDKEARAKEILAHLEWIKSKRFQHTYLPIFDKDSVYDTAKRIQQNEGLDVLIVDYFKSTGNGDAFATSQELGTFVDTVKNRICGQMDVAGLGAVQTSDTGRIAESQKIARNASTIAFMTDRLDQSGAKNEDGLGTKKLRIVFNRNGSQMSPDECIGLNFDGDHIMFTQGSPNLITGEQPF